MQQLPVAVIGAGPVGLAAAAHLIERGETPLVLEAGNAIGHAVRQWAHVRMFSPWRFNVDAAAARLLAAAGWRPPEPERSPPAAIWCLAPSSRWPTCRPCVTKSSSVRA